jgi:hypothetical protein
MKSFVSLKDLYICDANDMEPKEYDNDCSHLSKDSLMGSKVLA